MTQMQYDLIVYGFMAIEIAAFIGIFFTKEAKEFVNEMRAAFKSKHEKAKQ